MKRISWVACPKCQEYTDQKVRRSDRNSKHVIVRRRECYECGHIWHTIQYPEMIVEDIKAEDAVRLRQFLKKNPSTKGTGVAREHLDAGIISRVVYQLEHALNEL